MKELSSITYLMTKEDYVNCMLAERSGKTDKQDKRLLVFTGIMLCTVGAIIYAFRIKFLEIHQENFLAAVFGILGVIFIAYYDLIRPLFIKIKSENFCKKNPEKMISNTITLCDTGIKIKNDRYSAALPYEMLSGFYAGKEVIVIYINKTECAFIPKRTINEQAQNEFIKLLKENTTEL